MEELIYDDEFQKKLEVQPQQYLLFLLGIER